MPESKFLPPGMRWPSSVARAFEPRVAAMEAIAARDEAWRQELARARDEADAAGSVAKEAAEWVRRLAEAAPLLHVNDRKEGEALARQWLAAWDEYGGRIVAARAAGLARERERAVAEYRERVVAWLTLAEGYGTARDFLVEEGIPLRAYDMDGARALIQEVRRG